MIQPTLYNPISILAACIKVERAFTQPPSRLAAIIVAEHCKQILAAQWIAPLPKFNQVTPEDVDWCERQSAFPRLRVSAAHVADHQKKLLADVAAYRVRDAARVKELSELQRSASKYWKFCVAFEFPKVYDQAAMEAAAKHLMKTCPREHLKSLVAGARAKGLLEGSYLLNRQPELPEALSRKSRQCNRHYVLGKRSDVKDDLTFVRHQDSALAMEEASCQH